METKMSNQVVDKFIQLVQLLAQLYLVEDVPSPYDFQDSQHIYALMHDTLQYLPMTDDFEFVTSDDLSVCKTYVLRKLNFAGLFTYSRGVLLSNYRVTITRSNPDTAEFVRLCNIFFDKLFTVLTRDQFIPPQAYYALFRDSIDDLHKV